MRNFKINKMSYKYSKSYKDLKQKLEEGETLAPISIEGGFDSSCIFVTRSADGDSINVMFKDTTTKEHKSLKIRQ